MKIIIPMAGRGTRLRPHTLTTPKPLIPVAGKPIVHRLVEDIVKVCDEPVEEIGFIIGAFGKEVENQLMEIAEEFGAKGRIYYQEQALGTAHAILCAAPSLEGNVVIAFADTLFKADFKLDANKDGIIWVQKVDDPSAFGVVKLDNEGNISEFLEKPKDFVSDLAIIGIYYFKDGANLREELQFLIDHDVKTGGEYGLTDALENMKKKGVQFSTGEVEEWLDCGNKNATVNTNQRYLEYLKDKKLVADSAIIENSVIVPPVYIGENARIHNTVVGPHVSIGSNCIIENSVITNSIIQNTSKIKNANITNSMLGNHVTFEGRCLDLSIGDYTELKNNN